MVQSETKFKLPTLFIVSSGRSSTNLLASILNASEQIYIPYESDFIARAYPHYQHKDKLARQFNNFLYAKRDRKVYQQAHEAH